MAIGYVYALMGHLRGEDAPAQAASYVVGWEDVKRFRNVPDAVLRGIGAEVGDMLREGEIGEQIYSVWDTRMSAFTAIQVACERIRGTPTPFTYTLLLHRTAYAYCFLLPFGLVSTMGWGTPLFCGLVAYTFFGLDALGDELEVPFGDCLNALPLCAMARGMEINLLETLGVRDLPDALRPVRSVLR